MPASVSSLGLSGIDAYLVTVEADLARGIPAFDVVGLPDAAVREARDRVRAAIKNAGFRFPTARVVVNLAPAGTKKSGSAYDLAVLAAVLAADGAVDAPLEGVALLGELSLGGALRRLPGVLPMVLGAARLGLKEVIIPAENAAEGAVVQDTPVYAAQNVAQVLSHLRGEQRLPLCRELPVGARSEPPALPDLSDVRGQHEARRALAVAAAGMHNLLLIGPPGSGKSLLARRLPSILPEPAYAERVEATKIHSAAGLLPRGVGLLGARPFRSPHHGVSPAGLTGGGSHPTPGEVSLAHSGVLFLDELPEFSRGAMEGLRQPMEDGEVTISRVGARVTYPSQFMLVAAMNPCPCGYFGHPSRPCTCSPAAIRRYLGHVSGPLLDRIDIQVEVGPVAYQSMASAAPQESSAAVRERVAAARRRSLERLSGTKIHSNAAIPRALIDRLCPLTPDAARLLKLAFDRLGLSARGYDRVLRVARTVADLEGADVIAEAHLAEAVQYRSLDRKYWNA